MDECKTLPWESPGTWPSSAEMNRCTPWCGGDGAAARGGGRKGRGCCFGAGSDGVATAARAVAASPPPAPSTPPTAVAGKLRCCCRRFGTAPVPRLEAGGGSSGASGGASAMAKRAERDRGERAGAGRTPGASTRGSVAREGARAEGLGTRDDTRTNGEESVLFRYCFASSATTYAGLHTQAKRRVCAARGAAVSAHAGSGGGAADWRGGR